MKPNIVTLTVGAVILGVAMFGLTRPVVVNVSPSSLAGAAGPTHTGPEQFLDQVFISRQGDLDGSLPALTTSTTGSITAKIACENSVIDLTLPGTGVDVTLPSSSNMFNSAGGGCLTKVGDTRKFYVHNSTGTGNFTLVISDATSAIRLLTVATSSGAGVNGTSSLNNRDIAEVTGVRVASGTTAWLQWIITVFR